MNFFYNYSKIRWFWVSEKKYVNQVLCTIQDPLKTFHILIFSWTASKLDSWGGKWPDFRKASSHWLHLKCMSFGCVLIWTAKLFEVASVFFTMRTLKRFISSAKIKWKESGMSIQLAGWSSWHHQSKTCMKMSIKCTSSLGLETLSAKIT